MRNKKEVIIFTIVIVALLVITIGGIAFAYFASNIDSNANLNLDVSTADKMYTFESETNDNIELNINFNEMNEAGSYTSVDDFVSTPIKRDTANIKVSLTNPEEEMMTKCTYDIVWVWDSADRYTEPDVELPYELDDPFILYLAEFGIMIDNHLDSEVRDLSELEHDEDRVILKSGASITVGGKETKTVNHKITAAIYNLPVDQPNLFNKNFKAHIDIENVNCKMESVSTMNTVCSEGGNLAECIKKLGDSKNAYVGDGQLILHNGTFLGLDYTNRNNLYIMDEHSTEYDTVDDLITYQDSNVGIQYYLAYDPSSKGDGYYKNIVKKAIDDGYLGIKKSSLDANDNGYRYSGNQPNNYICFGAGSEKYNNGETDECPLTNKYRIIGLVPVIKSDGTEDKLVKIIKAEYITASELGKGSSDGSVASAYTNNARIEADYTTLEGFHWNDSSSLKNIWEGSSLYNSLNNETTGYLNFLYGDNKATWENKIEEVQWNVGGWRDYKMTAKAMYDAEMTDGGYYTDSSRTDTIKQGSGTTTNGKVGLMYAHDYGFAASKDYWDTYMYTYYGSQNWLFNGAYEWTISRETGYNDYWTFAIQNIGYLVNAPVYSGTSGVRPVLYLNSDINILKGDGEYGSREKPFKISLS